MATRMQQRRGTAAQWLSTNNGNGPVLNVGEIGYETDTNKFKIGDGTNHWIDLNYFADSVELGGSIDDYIPLTQKGVANGVATLNSSGVIPAEQIPSLVGLDTEITSAVNTAVTNLVGVAPSALDTLAELAGALNNDEDFSSTVANELSLKASTAYVDNEIDTLTSTLTSDISTAVTTHNNDTTLVHGIDDTSVLVTLSGTQTLANKTFEGITINANILQTIYLNVNSGGIAQAYGSGYLSSGMTLTIPEFTYYGDGLVYPETTVTLTSTPITVGGYSGFTFDQTYTGTYSAIDESQSMYMTVQIQDTAPATISQTEIGYLDGVTSSIQTQLNSKAATGAVGQLAKDAVGNSVGTGLSYDGSTGAISVDETIIDSNISAALVAPTISTSLTLDGSGDFTIAADANIVLDATTEVYIGSAASGNEVATKSYVDSGLGDKLDSSTAASTYAPIASPTFTGTSTTNDLVVNGDFTVNGTNFSASATSITIEDNLVQLAHQNAANTVDLGLVVAYNDGTAKHAGIVRDVSDAKWKLFKDVSTEPSTVVAFGEGSLDDLALNNLSAVDVTLTGDISAVDATFTGTVTGVTKSHVGLGNVDNTADADKPVSTATQTALDAKSDKVIVINPQTSNYTLTLSDVDDLVEMNVSSANTLTVPANADVALPVGTRVHIVQTGSGQTTITPGSGVTVNGTPGLKTRAQWSAVTLVKRATNTWVAFGDLTA